MLEMAKMSSFILVAHVDNGQMDLKIYLVDIVLAS